MANKNTLYNKLVNESTIDILPTDNPLRYSLKLKLLIISITVLIITVFFSLHFEDKIYNNSDFKLMNGYVWQNPTLTADFSFPIFKSNNLINQEIKSAKEQALIAFVQDKTVVDEANKIIEQISILLTAPVQQSELSDYGLSEKTIRQFFELPQNQRIKENNKLIRALTDFIKDIYSSGFINLNLNKIKSTEISVHISANEEIILKKVNLVDKSIFAEKAEKYFHSKFSKTTKDIAIEISQKINNPNLIFSKELSDKHLELAEKSVAKTIGFVKQGEVIVRKGEVLNENTILKIKSYETSRFLTSDNIIGFSYYVGSLAHSMLAMAILFIYLGVIRKRIMKDNIQVLILCLILIATAALSWLSIELESEFPIEYLIPLPAFSMLVAIVFDSRSAFIATVAMSQILAGIRGNDYAISLTMMFAGMLAAYTVRDIQNRTQMFQSVFFIFIGLTVPVLIFAAERSSDSISIIKTASVTLLTSVVAPLITFGLLFIIERLTNISSDLRIKEYDKLDHPLLLKMSETAPGTYQHTMGVAMLAERCAREIGANPLLAKVGAYFHDIGKMTKPEYFTENQIGIENKHDQLSPKKSVKLIIDHVSDGIELGKQYKIPQRILDFIPMHHGTSLIKHFYAKALEEANGESINQNDFRYAGPKPKSKEAAIMMICDFAEAISRLDSRTLVEIEEIISGNIQERIADGQFDECNITIEELSKIKQLIAKNLLGMTHKRVNYKTIPKQ